MSNKVLFLLLLSPSVYAWGEDKPECLEFGSSAFIGMGLGFGSGFLKSSGSSTFFPNVVAQAPGTTQTYDFIGGISTSGTSMTGFLFNPQLGWNCRLRNTRVVFGVIAGGSVSTMATAIAYPSVQVTKNAAGTSATLSGDVTTARVSDGGWFDAGFRFGVVAGSSLIFVRLGWAVHSLRSKISFAGNSIVTSRWSNALLTGLGVDFNLTPNVVLGAEADVHIASKTQFNFVLNQGYTAFIRTRPVILALFATLKYAFPSAQ